MSRRLFFRPEVYQPLVVIAITGLFDLFAHYTLQVFCTSRAQIASLITVLLSGASCAVLLSVWQRQLRKQVKLLELHLQTRQVVETRVRSSLSVLLNLAERNRGINPKLDRDIDTAVEQIRSIEKRIAFDPSILIEVTMLAYDERRPPRSA